MQLPVVYSDMYTTETSDEDATSVEKRTETPDIPDVAVGDEIRISYIPNGGGIGAKETLTGEVTGDFGDAVEIDHSYWVSESIVGVIGGEKIGSAGMVETRV